MESNAEEHLSKQFSRYLTGFCRSKAILEDYVRVVSKLEGISEEVVKERIEKRTNELFQEVKKEYSQFNPATDS